MIPADTPIKPLMHYASDDQAANPEWLAEQREIETEGERTPSQIEIRADFARRAFCLYTNGEAVGASSQYKAVALVRRALLAGEIA